MRSVNLDDEPPPFARLYAGGPARPDLAAALESCRRERDLEREAHRTAGAARDRYLRLLVEQLGRARLQELLEESELEDCRRLSRHEAESG
jgi:hypothetical protein